MVCRGALRLDGHVIKKIFQVLPERASAARRGAVSSSSSFGIPHNQTLKRLTFMLWSKREIVVMAICAFVFWICFLEQLK